MNKKIATNSSIQQIRKRDGRIAKFDQNKITEAIFKAAKAVGGKDREKAQKLSDEVIQRLNEKYATQTPNVEQVQDAVEKVLIENGHAKTAKAYILYREQHKIIRDVKSFVNSNDIMDGYLQQLDWRVKENSNMAYSLQGLNNHISSIVSSNYWLHKIYPQEVRKAHLSGDFHLHDLQLLASYCCGWEIKDILLKGFGGVPGKVESRPPKHLRTALGQLANFLYTVQGEIAGANAVSSFDTYLAPFVKYGGLNYKQVKQAMQEFIFNMNVPTRVGFQCLSEDTEILTPNGWANYENLKVGDVINTFNAKKGAIENKRIKKLFKQHYKGAMYNLKNRIQDQLISPGHKVVRKKFNSEEYVLEEIENVLKLKSWFIIPIAGKNTIRGSKLKDDEINLLAWIIAEGTIEKYTSYRHSSRITIYQSEIRNPQKYQEIITLLKKFNLTYNIRDSYPALGDSVKMIRLNAESSRRIHKFFGTKERIDFIPKHLLNLNKRQSSLFLETYLKADGFENCKISTTNINILDGLQQIAVNAEYGFTVLTRKPTIGNKLIYILRLIKHKETYIVQTKKVDYEGIIWCPNTENETVIARRKGKVFITGNTPFSNLTMDTTVPKIMQNEQVIIGGKLKDDNYGDFQEEMGMINRAFAEVMIEGDSKGRVFTFPIPTYNITRETDFENESLDKLWEMTCQYGIPYFSNFVNSDMKPEDVRSMCCRLRLSNKELRRRGGGLFGANPLTGSIGVATINMPRLGYLAKNETDFLEQLKKVMDVAKTSLEIKRKAVERFTEQGLYPYSKFYLAKIKEVTKQYWGNHFNTIGLVGMNEACLNLLGINIAERTARRFALNVLDFMREQLSSYQEETGNNYNLEESPAEGATYRLAKLDKGTYPDIITAGEKDPYYTNSTHLPVNYTNNIFEALEHQDEFKCKYTGGSVLHGFLGERINDTEACKKLVKRIAYNYKLPYYTLTPTFSICRNHGYIRGEEFKCPTCKKDTEVYSRVVGYLRPVQSWNTGKREEYGQRKTYAMEKC